MADKKTKNFIKNVRKSMPALTDLTKMKGAGMAKKRAKKNLSILKKKKRK